MCAIAGIIGLPFNRETAALLLATMARRGPDDRGIYQKQDTTLLHARLAIIDPEGGSQPMTLEWNRETYVLVYNGELYNTEELRRELSALGHSFLGHSDTEVVLHAYAQWGRACLHRFNGIFAFAVWEEGTKRLFLARDRIGVKPLFYTESRQGLIFASEIKTILACPGVKAELDREGAVQLLMLGPGRLPGSGVLRNIRELEPGCCGYFDRGKLTRHRYWRLEDRPHTDTFEETVERVRYLVTDAIRRQMVSDVPIGTFLSGGLDSSIISAVCAGELSKRGETLPTFSVDYLNNERYFRSGKFQPSADSAYIDTMVRTLGTQHSTTVLTPEDLLFVLEDATVARDLPGMADVDFSLLAFCRQVRNRVKVALSGECADEIFGGYPWYRDPEIRDRAGFPWAQNISQRLALLNPALASFGKPEEMVLDACLDTCRGSDILPGTDPQERRVKEMVNLNFRWFMQTLLDRKDRMSMYSGLEVRVPFCDYRIAEYLYTVPWAYKEHGGMEKGLLRRAVEGLLPETVLRRKKSPYPKTFDPSYAEMIRIRMDALLADPTAPLFHLVSRDALSRLPEQKTPWPWYGQLMGGPQTMAYFLQLDFWLRHYGVDILL